MQSEGLDKVKSDLTGRLAVDIAKYIRETPVEPGTHLSAQFFADHFGTSRSPIQGAFSLLSAQGVLAREKNRGYFVTPAAHTLDLPDASAQGDRISSVYLQIANDLLDRAIPNAISESALRERYDLSQVEVRSLLSRIQKEGWIERRAGYGWEFNEMLQTPDALAQTYRMRLALEPAALLEPDFSISAEELDKLAATERAFLDGLIETAPVETLYERGVVFHETLTKASGNIHMLDALQRVNQIRRLIVYRSMVNRERYYKQSQEHLEIIELVRRGAMREAAIFMRHHLSNVMLNHDAIEPLIRVKSRDR